jgi:PhnB protein
MKQSFSPYINFDGNCREALEFYAKVFGSEASDIMTYGQMPPDPSFPIPEKDKEHVMHSTMPIFGCNIMFCDVPSDMPLTKGDNINPTLSSDDKAEIQRVFAALADGGEVLMPLENTFWSELYGMVQDKYGIIWQLSHAGVEMFG